VLSPLAAIIFAIYHPPPPHHPESSILISVSLSLPLVLCAIVIAGRK